MNRRSFTRGLASLGLSPALPVAAMGGGSSAAVAATVSAEKMYFMGWYTPRLNKTCSPDMLVSELNVNPDVAREIFSKLVSSKTISAPNALGVSRTIDPLADSLARVSGRAAKRIAQEPSKTGLRERLEKMKQAVGDVPDEEEPAEEAFVAEEMDDVGEAETQS